MKVCNENDLLINLYIDGELSGPEARALEAHMAGCPACRAYCDQLCMVNRAVCDAAVPSDLHSSIMGAVWAAQEADKVVDFEDIPKKKKNTLWKRLGTVAAMLAIAFVGLFGGMGGLGGLGFAQKTESAADTNRMMALTEDAAVNESMPFKMAERDAAAPEMEMKNEPATGAAPQAMQIETPMLAWFNDSRADNVTAVQISDALPSESVEEETGAGRTMDDGQVQALAELLQAESGNYGFYLLASGRLIDLPAIFADQAGEEAAAGCALVITVRNSDAVRLQIADNLQKAGFALYDDADGLWFDADPTADEGLLIVDLTE